MPPVRTVFQSNSIEFERNPEASKAAMIRAIGELLVHAGYSLVRHAQEMDFAIPDSFDLVKEVDGWDLRFVLRLNVRNEEPEQDNLHLCLPAPDPDAEDYETFLDS